MTKSIMQDPETDHQTVAEEEITFEAPTPGFEEQSIDLIAVLLNLSDITAEGYTILKKRETRIGRDSSCEIAIDDARVSRRHANLILDPPLKRGEKPTVTLVDNNSMNGVFVNGEDVEGQRMLRDGDRIHIGGTEFGFFIRTRIEVSLEARHRALLRERGYVPADARVPVEFSVTIGVLFPEDTFSPKRIPATIRDISRKGARLSTGEITRDLYAKMMRTKRYVRVEANVPGNDQRVLLRGQVVWMHYDEKDSEIPTCSMGVCFDPEDKQSRCLVDYLTVRYPSEKED